MNHHPLLHYIETADYDGRDTLDHICDSVFVHEHCLTWLLTYWPAITSLFTGKVNFEEVQYQLKVKVMIITLMLKYSPGNICSVNTLAIQSNLHLFFLKNLNNKQSCTCKSTHQGTVFHIICRNNIQVFFMHIFCLCELSRYSMWNHKQIRNSNYII